MDSLEMHQETQYNSLRDSVKLQGEKAAMTTECYFNLDI